MTELLNAKAWFLHGSSPTEHEHFDILIQGHLVVDPAWLAGSPLHGRQLLTSHIGGYIVGMKIPTKCEDLWSFLGNIRDLDDRQARLIKVDNDVSAFVLLA